MLRLYAVRSRTVELGSDSMKLASGRGLLLAAQAHEVEHPDRERDREEGDGEEGDRRRGCRASRTCSAGISSPASV